MEARHLDRSGATAHQEAHVLLQPALAALRTVIRPALTPGGAVEVCDQIDRLLTVLIVQDQDNIAAARARWVAAAAQLQASAHLDDALPDGALALVQAEHALLTALDSEGVALANGTSPEANGPDQNPTASVSTEQLTSWFRSKLPGRPDLTVTALHPLTGGRVKETLRCSVSGAGSDLPEQVVIRKDQPTSLLPTTAADEYGLLKFLHAREGLPVPRPLLAEHDPEVFGGGFLVLELAPGVPAGDLYPELGSPSRCGPEIMQHLAAVLGRLHSIPLSELLDAEPPAHLKASTDLDSVIDGITGRFPEQGTPWPGSVLLAQQWLHSQRSAEVDDVPHTLAHNDIGLHNILIDGPRITALLDWETATIGPPSRDLARCWHLVRRYLPWEDFLQAYLDAGGPEPAVAPSAIRFQRVLVAASATATACYAGHLARRGDASLVMTHAGVDLCRRSQLLLTEALQDALAAPAP